MKEQKYTTNSEKETIELGHKFASSLNLGELVAFYGDLGTGKTEFIKGICGYFEVKDIVTSPTFTIMNHYLGHFDEEVEFQIYHIDLYRIKEEKELDEIGFQDCIYSPNTIKLVEWAEKGEINLPENRYNIKITADETDEDKREIIIQNAYVNQLETER